MKQYLSPRGHLLVYTVVPHRTLYIPVLTCELYPKWYALYLIAPESLRLPPERAVEVADLSNIEKYAEPGQSAVGDHCWNPTVLQAMCDDREWWVDEVALDLLMGRWVYNRDVQEKVT